MIRGNVAGSVSHVGNNNSGIIGDVQSVGSMHSGHTTTTSTDNTTRNIQFGDVTAGNGGSVNENGDGGAGGDVTVHCSSH